MKNCLRKSWDTNVKHYVRAGLYNNLPCNLKNQISSSNLSRWKNESNNKYLGSEVAKYIAQDIELYKKIGQNSNLKKLNESYFKLIDALHFVIRTTKGIQQKIAENKDYIINIIENLKDDVPIDKAIKIFNISRSTYQNYKTLVINKCDDSYFLWCVKNHPQQLLKTEILIIKNYMENEKYRSWSKSSVYLKAVRDVSLFCCLSTFYKYCNLLGFKMKRKKQKGDDYNPVKTTHPNELWCADVTIFKTPDGVKHYIHFLMDHYSKMILGYTIEKSSNGKAIKKILKEAYIKYKPKKVSFLTDGGTENVNTLVSSFLNSLIYPIKHIVAQKDVIFSNSMVEALNKTIKHEFLYPKQIYSGIKLKNVLDESVTIYNSIRPQKSLGGNTPLETHSGNPINFIKYSHLFKQQKLIRIEQNQSTKCKKCS